MKIKFLTIKKKSIIIFLLCILAIGVFCGAYFPVKVSTSPKPLHTIVIDAGHGGIDAGSSGKTTGVKESDLNLRYAKALKAMCEDSNIKVVMTRKDENGLYSPNASNKKKSEMQKRKQIIDNSDADLVISIHMNSFNLASCKGAQVFYAKGNEAGKNFATSVQSFLHDGFSTAKQTASIGDYFVLNCTDKPAILVEFGFLSNPEEEKLLQTDDYMKKMCYCVLGGILEYYKA